MAAPTAIEERDALTPCVILARLLARREVGHFARRLAAVDLPSARVALGVGADLLPRALRSYEGNDWRAEFRDEDNHVDWLKLLTLSDINRAWTFHCMNSR